MASKEKGKPHTPGRGWDYAGVPEEGGDSKPALVFHSRFPPGIQTCGSNRDNRGPRGFASIPREEADAVAGGRVACKDQVSRPSHTTFSFIRSNPRPPSGPPSVQPSTWRGPVGFSPGWDVEEVLLPWKAPHTPSLSPEPEAMPTTHHPPTHGQPQQPR